MIFSKGTITFYRGDDDALLVALDDDVVFEVGDTVYFSVKAEKDDLVDIFQITSTDITTYTDDDGIVHSAVRITIPHTNTINMELGTYFYDILIRWADGTYVTVVPPSRFKLQAGGSHV